MSGRRSASAPGGARRRWWKPRVWLRAALGAGLGTLVLLLLLEGVLRLFGYGDYIIYGADADLLWVPLPGQRGKTVEGRLPITINRQGLRYPVELPLHADPGETRIYAFGDSVTMGWGVDDASHYSAALERMLAERDPQRTYRVVSAGVNAYPVPLCVRRFEHLLEQGHPMDIAILAYSFNNRHEALVRLRGAERERFLRKVRLKSLLRRSALYNLVIEDWLRGVVYYRIRERLVAGSWDVDEPGTPRSDPLDHYVAALERMKAAADRHGVRLVFLLLVSENQSDALVGRQVAFVDFARSNGIPVVDVLGAFRSRPELYMDHVHPTAAGHRILAESLLPVIERLEAARPRDR